MNFTVIPYFLAVMLKDADWPFGPEYIFKLNKTSELYKEPFTTIEMNCELQCQPRVPDSLICLLPNFTIYSILTYENSSKQISPFEVIQTSHLFEIRFNRSGEQSILMKGTSHPTAVDIVKQVAELLNVNTDLSKRTYEELQLQKDFYLIDEFTELERTSRGSCDTQYKITHDKDATDNESHKYHFVVLPLADLKINATISIEKTRENCVYSEQYMETLNEMNGTHDFGGMSINSTFTSFTELVGSMSLNPWNSASKTRIFSKRVDLSLIEIRHASKALPNIS